MTQNPSLFNSSQKFSLFNKLNENYGLMAKNNDTVYESIFNNSFDAILIYDYKKGVYIDANRSACKLFKYPKETLIGLTPARLKPKVLTSGKEASKVVKDAFHKVRSEKRIEFETTNLKSDGTIFETSISLVDITYKGRHCALITLKDISEKKKAKTAIKASEETYKKIFNSSFDAILVYEIESNTYLDANESACKLFKYAKKDLLSLMPEDLKPKKLITGEQTNQALKGIFKRIKTEKRIEFETTNLKSDGTVFETHISIVNITYYGKACCLVTLKDISEKKKAERELKSVNNKLQKYIESNLELENFTYLASHDVREPLRTINSFSQLLEKRFGHQCDETAKEYLGYITHSARNLNRIVHDLLAYSKVNTRVVKPTTVHIHQMVNDLIRIKKAENVSIEMNFKASLLPITIQADEFKIYEIFDNLINNTIQFKADNRPLKVQISHTESEDEWCFKVEDNGIGIKEVYFEKIFMLFKKLESKHVSGGTGVGLAMCKKAVEQHKGEIWVTSEFGKGTCFYFTIPK